MYFLRYCFFILINLVPLIFSINQKCPVSTCENSYFSIQYPFILQGQHPQICSNYTSLECLYGNKTILNLPYSGDFYVREINYDTQTVQLNDPGNCLPRRLMNLSLSSSIFTSAYYQNYTFYNCPKSKLWLTTGFTPIDCLSTDSHAIIVSSSASPTYMSRNYGCTIITSATLPVSWLGQFDNIEIYDLQLTWDVPRCEDCDQYPETVKGQSNWSKIVQSPFFFPSVTALVIILTIVCHINSKRTIDHNRTPANNDTGDIAASPLATTSTVALPPQSTGGGATTAIPDDPKVDSYTISIIVEENSGTSCPQGSSTCAICLEDYRENEKIKCIILCQHCFHANCIDQWLHMHSSCPVCRTSLS